MSQLVLEVSPGGEWRSIGTLREGEPQGSLSNNLADGKRDVLMFTCLGDHGLIERSVGGADREVADRTMRLTATLGLEQVARLYAGEEHRFMLRTDRMAVAVHARFRYEATS